MAQRFSGRDRQTSEFYPTPAWVTHALLDNLGVVGRLHIWEPAAGEGSMSIVLGERHSVISSDVRWPEAGEFWPPESERNGREPTEKRIRGVGPVHRWDFLREDVDLTSPDAVITNPPYGIQGKLAERFIRRALDVVRPRRGIVAMLLKADFDSGSTRRDIFADCAAWSRKIVLLRRIVWFEPVPDPVTGRTSGPSENHCWYVWSWQHIGPPIITYANGEEEGLSNVGHQKNVLASVR